MFEQHLNYILYRRQVECSKCFYYRFIGLYLCFLLLKSDYNMYLPTWKVYLVYKFFRYSYRSQLAQLQFMKKKNKNKLQNWLTNIYS